MRKILVSTQSGSYTISVGNIILPTLSRQVAALARSPRSLVFVLTAPEIWALWGERLQACLAPREPVVLFLPAGERHKRMTEVERLATEMTVAGADRSSLLIAFGGGVTGDVGGFLSAIYMRGIEYIQIPTTLLSQVDSSVGGKTGVNLQTGKNLVGCFYPPKAVIADIALLQTLPPRELRAGVYESIKAGLIRDPALFRYIEKHREAIDRGDAAPLEKTVAASIRIKADVVGQDEREHGLRMILNFGHTIGHAIEAATKYSVLLHGEAVAWGMIAALHISRERQMLRAPAVDRITRLILSFQPRALPALKAERLLQAASGDKKNQAGVRRFILLEELGKAVVLDDVTDAEVIGGIESMQRLARSR